MGLSENGGTLLGGPFKGILYSFWGINGDTPMWEQSSIHLTGHGLYAQIITNLCQSSGPRHLANLCFDRVAVDAVGSLFLNYVWLFSAFWSSFLCTVSY